MVSLRCKMIIRSELGKMHLHFVLVESALILPTIPEHCNHLLPVQFLAPLRMLLRLASLGQHSGGTNRSLFQIHLGQEENKIEE
jgi:hypothetical protein